MPVFSDEFIKGSGDSVVQWARQALEESRESRSKATGIIEENWDFAEKTYLNADKFLRDGSTSRYAVAPRENLFFLVVELQKYTFMENVPDPQFFSRFPGNLEDEVAVLNTLQDFAFEIGNFSDHFGNFVHNLLVLGTGIMRIWWDVNGFGGRGAVGYKAVDPRNFLVSAGANSLQDATYIIEASFLDVDKAIARWGNKRDEIKRKIDSTLIGGKTSRSSSQSFLREKSPREIELVEVFVKDHGDGEIYRAAILGGDILVEGPEPLGYLHGMFPFVSAQSRFNPDSIYGWMDFLFVDSLQRELDRLNDKRNAYTELSYFPYLLVPKGAGEDVTPEKLAQRPGAIIRPTLNATNSIRFLSPPPVGRHIQVRRNEIQDWVKKVVGTGQISETALQRNLQPTTVSQVVQAFEAPVRYKLRLMECAMKQLAVQTVSLMAQFFDGDIIVQFSDDRNASVSFERLRDLNRLGLENFAVQVGIPSHVPLNSAFRVSRIVDAVRNGAYDRRLPIEAREALMHAFGVPGRKKIIKRERERAELQEALELLQMEINVRNLTAQNEQLKARGISISTQGEFGLGRGVPARPESAPALQPLQQQNNLLKSSGLMPQGVLA